jgi:hypothetical protein
MGGGLVRLDGGLVPGVALMSSTLIRRLLDLLAGPALAPPAAAALAATGFRVFLGTFDRFYRLYPRE